ncbi:energy-coupling factor transporter transmembrane protein EcfT [bacterium]|nr:energy-coupling factor transporter transmembrane protein EcfT [bacterium]
MRSSWLYQDRGSCLHRLHPMTKLIALLLLFVAAFAFNDPRWMAPYVVFIVALFAVGRVLDNLWRNLRFVLLFFVLSVLLWTLFLRDVDPTWHWGIFAASRTSLLFGVAVGLRLAFLILAGMLFLSTTTVEDTAYAMRQLRLPEMMLLAFTLAFRLVPSFMRSAMAAADAQRSRGLELDRGGPFKRLGRTVPLMVPVLARGLRSADDLTRALEVRGVSAERRRTHLKEYHSRAADLLVAGVLVLATAAAIAARLQMHAGELLPRI